MRWYSSKPTWVCAAPAYIAQHGALASIDARKRQKLILAAQYFLQRQARWANHPCRFDVVTMDSATPQLNWLRNAFDSH